MSNPSLTIYNNSDDETSIQTKEDDFVSFPTIADPELDNPKTLTKMITKTLRKVTHNASNLVTNYSSTHNESTKLDKLDNQDTESQEIKMIKRPTIQSSGDIIDENGSEIQISSDINKHSNDDKDIDSLLPTKVLNSSKSFDTRIDDVYGLYKLDELKGRPVVATTSHPKPPSIISKDDSITPRVTSDNKTLRLSTLIPKDSFSSTSSLINISATQVDIKSHPPIIKGKSLSTKISSIFNNLPNDIELSDDSASDTETITEPQTSPNVVNLSTNISTPHLSSYDMRFNTEAIVKSSPIMVESTSSISRNRNGESSLSSFHALKSKEDDRKKNRSSNLSDLILGNAKSIINNNLVTSAASSIVTNRSKDQNRTKKKPKTSSKNPLKNGGIPKKYWMNDSFVSDCLNCFKPFTAFRRKHHCRFCGQIFCARCTLFISYNQHKEERKKGGPIKKTYNDKLRVCKPCYSDVIVYLSDDSSSSEDEDDKTNPPPIALQNDDLFKVDASSRQLSRGRSASVTSRLSHPKIASSQFTTSSNESLQQTDTLGIPLEINAYPKQAPQKMAIPATRKGEAVEIPLPRNSYSSINEKFNTMSHFSQLSNHHFQHVGTPTSSSKPTDNVNVTPKNWLKNYNHLMSASLSTPDLNKRPSFENINNMYFSLIGRKSSQSKFRVQSNSEKDLYQLHKGKAVEYGSAQDNKSGSEDSSDFYSDEDDKEHESEHEDEQAMSLYTSLTLGGTPKITPRINQSASANVVPTLREFPSMQNNEVIFPRFPGFTSNSSIPKILNTPSSSSITTQKKQIVFLEEHPQSESIRSHERAHASLVRMRSRRKSKANKNLLILTENTFRLPSFDKSNWNVIVTPTSPTTSQAFNSPKVNPSKLITGNLESNDSAFDTQVSPIGRKSKTFQLDASQDLADDEDNGDFESSYPLIHDFESDIDEYVSINLAYSNLLDKILLQCLNDCDIDENQDRWMAALKIVLTQIDRIKLTDTLDIRQYVKIKKLAGGSIEDTSVLDGLFITKNIDSKNMSFSIKNPKIALLMFPIEYLKQKEQFISLRIIHSQQSVYITNLVSRLVSMGPDIVVVGDTVCGLALNLLEEAGVTVLSNTKPQIIERISRYTKADIFQSVNDLFFKKGVLGTCKLFEVRRSRYKNIVKTFSFFIGTDMSSGFTIKLRGGDEDHLNSIKYAAETLMPGYLNARFEKSLFEDHGIRFSAYTQNDEVEQMNRKFAEIQNYKEETDNEEDELCKVSLDSTEVVNYVKLFNERSLSLSPAVKYTLPTPLVNVINAYYDYHQYFKVNKKIQNTKEITDLDKSYLQEFQIKFDELPQEKDLLAYLKFASDDHLGHLINEYQNRARIWSNCMTYPTYQLYPIFHRQIYVLHSSVSIKHATPCNGPNTVVVDYYTDNDKCLGSFLDQTFQESSQVCSECGDSLLNHFKTYVHGNAKLDVIIEKFDGIKDQHNYPSKNHRVMWSYCKICNHSTPIVPMHDETYYLSIGKFLELNFYGEHVYVNSGECSHNFFKNYIKCFGYNDLIIRLEYSNIDNYEVVVPKKQLEFLSELDINLKIDVMNSIREKSTKFFKSISKRLERVKVDTYDKAEEGLKKIEDLKSKLENQISQIEQKTEEIYNSSLPVNYIGLNTVLRDLQVLGVEWDKEFDEFEKKFLPSETEITKITQFHLRSFLLDKYNENDQMKSASKSEYDGSEAHNSESDMKNDGNEKDPSLAADDASVSMRDSISIATSGASIGSSADAEHHLPILNRAKTKEIGNMIPTSLYDQSNFMEKISMWKELVERESANGSGRSKSIGGLPSSLSLRAMSRKQSSNSILNSTSNYNTSNLDLAGASSSKVHQLASFFDKMNIDQISFEFKKQRERELQKKSKNKFIPIPILESKPIVEIYDNIEDAVIDDGSLNPILSNEVIQKKVDTENKENRDSTPTNTNKSLDIAQPEKQSLLKSLTNFWADRSATLWDPLEYALESHEHTFADSDVIVREDEPSSLVAFCLSSSDYKQKIKIMEQETEDGGFADPLEGTEINSKKYQKFIKIEKKFKKNHDRNANMNELETMLIKNKSNHLKYQFSVGNTNLSCKIFYSEQFEALRKACGNFDTFIQSLSRCVKWDSKGGKSRSSFLKTLDNRYIIKELSSSELESFVSIAPFYFRYISQSIFNNLSTAIAKIYGFYQIEIKNNSNGKIFKMDFLIMENLFYNHNTTRIFDLKGSMRNRHVQQTGKEDEVLLDENMIEYIYESPVFVKEHSKKVLRGSLFNDTSFLSAMDVMDYSLVVGIDDKSNKLYIGIIDWLRTFTWDKKVENWVKGSNLIGGNRKRDPTIVTPKQYRTRFREAMERYILEVPDIWYEGTR